MERGGWETQLAANQAAAATEKQAAERSFRALLESKQVSFMDDAESSLGDANISLGGR